MRAPFPPPPAIITCSHNHQVAWALGLGRADASGLVAEDVDEQLSSLRRQGLRARDAVREVARRTGHSHREVYRRWLALSRSATPDA